MYRDYIECFPILPYLGKFQFSLSVSNMKVKITIKINLSKIRLNMCAICVKVQIVHVRLFLLHLLPNLVEEVKLTNRSTYVLHILHEGWVL